MAEARVKTRELRMEVRIMANSNDSSTKSKKPPQKGSAFDNQKQLRLGADSTVEPQKLAGDQSTDNRIDINDAENNLEWRAETPAGGPFMHPMHDATADPQLDTKKSKPEPRR